MANKKYDKEDGVWRTIGGRRVFIRTGQKLSDAMKESGKFKQGNRHEVQQAKAEKKIEELGKENEEIWKETNKFDNNWYDESGALTKEGRKFYNKREANAEEMKILQQFNRDYQARVWEDDRYNNPIEYTGDLSGLEGKHIAGKETEELLGGKDKFYIRKDGTKEYDPYKGTRFEKKYDSVMDRYEKDSDFRGMLEREHQKSLDTTRKEINSYFDMTLEDRKRLVGNEDDLYKALNQDYGNIDREDFDKIYNEEMQRRVAVDTAKRFGAKDVTVNGEKIDLKKYTADEQDILDRFGEDYGYDKGSNLDNLIGQIDYMKNPGESIHRTAERLVEGGDFLIYNGDVMEYLDERGIKYTEDNFFDKYKKDMADKIERLYNQGASSNLKTRFKGTYEDLKENTNMSEAEILEFLKKLKDK